MEEPTNMEYGAFSDANIRIKARKTQQNTPAWGISQIRKNILFPSLGL
jgi:hypothetical protein